MTALPDSVDLVIVGAGPAGLAAAAAAAGQGTSVLLLDEQAAPGGQIYRGLSGTGARLRTVLGDDYVAGRTLLDGLGASAIDYRPDTAVWQVQPPGATESGFEIGATVGGAAAVLRADRVIVATGAQERPVPVPGWTLPGVMTVGAAQGLLKTAGVVAEAAVIAGSGPLLWLLAWQYVRAGAPPALILDTTPRGNYARAVRHLPSALGRAGDIAKGLGWMRAVRRAGVTVTSGVDAVAAEGNGRVTEVRWRQGGQGHVHATRWLLLHQGVVPHLHLPASAGCRLCWHGGMRAWRPWTDDWGNTSVDGLAVAGDGAGIEGALASAHAGGIAGLEAARALGHLTPAARDRLAAPARRALARERRFRPFLDALYAPAGPFLRPADAVVVCRCEEVTAGAVRAAARHEAVSGLNQLKAFLRCGMGPCQGRQCALTVGELIAEARGVAPGAVPPARLRPPVRPLTLGALATLAEEDPEEDLAP